MASSLSESDFYIENGLYVFTEQFLLRRGYCCKNNCRHCPYQIDNECTTISKITYKGDQMAVSKNDLQELRRIATNTYDADKAFMHRVIKGIGDMDSEIQKLKSQVTELEQKLAAKK